MAAEGGRAARGDGTHDAAFVTAEMTDMGLPERFAVAAEDIRHLQCRSHDARSAGRHDLQAEPIEWARRLANGLGGDPGVARRARQAGMAEQDLNDAHVLSRRCVAKLCRSVCTVTSLLRPAAVHAERQAACSTFETRGCS